MQLIGFLLMQSAETLLRRNQAQESINSNEALDDEDKELQQEEAIDSEDELLTVYVDVIGHFLKIQREKFMPVFDKMIAPAFLTYLSSDQPLALQTIVCCLMDDVIEFGGAEAYKYLPQLIPTYLMNTQLADNDETHLLRQCSMYGLGMMCLKAPEALANTFIPAANGAVSEGTTYIGPLLSCLITTILHPDATLEDNHGITENALFGLFNLIANKAVYGNELQKQSTTFPLFEIYKLVLKKLPLKLDGVEIKATLHQFVNMVESNDSFLLAKDGNQYIFLADILRILGDALLNYSGSSSNASNAQNILTSPDSITGPTEAEKSSSSNGIVLHPITVQRIETMLRQFKSSNIINEKNIHVLHDFPIQLQNSLKTFFQ